LINRGTFLKDLTAIGLDIEDRVRLLEELHNSFGLVLPAGPVRRRQHHGLPALELPGARPAHVVSLEAPISRARRRGASGGGGPEPGKMEETLRSVVAVRPEVLVLSAIPDAATAMLATQLAARILVVAVLSAQSAAQVSPCCTVRPPLRGPPDSSASVPDLPHLPSCRTACTPDLRPRHAPKRREALSFRARAASQQGGHRGAALFEVPTAVPEGARQFGDLTAIDGGGRWGWHVPPEVRSWSERAAPPSTSIPAQVVAAFFRPLPTSSPGPAAARAAWCRAGWRRERGSAASRRDWSRPGHAHGSPARWRPDRSRRPRPGAQRDA
jgi:hypothetical protein